MNSLAYAILTIVISPLLGGGLVYWIQSRIRINEAKEQAGVASKATAEQTPIEVLKHELDSKGIALQQTQAQFFAFVESQMQRNDATTRAMLDMAAESRAHAAESRAQTDTLKAVGASLQAHREEASARAGKLYEKIGDVNERLASIEGRVAST